MRLRMGAADRVEEPSCATSALRCRPVAGAANHDRWPKAREGEVLEWISRYRLE
jgi:hypothetical protein